MVPPASEPTPDGVPSPIVPVCLTLRAAAPNKSLLLRAYSAQADPVAAAAEGAIARLGGASVRHAAEAGERDRQLWVGARLPSLSRIEIRRIRDAIRAAGGWVDSVRTNYRIGPPSGGLNQRPRPCRGCRHYYGQGHGNAALVCAMHPFGPSEDPCRDWAPQG